MEKSDKFIKTEQVGEFKMTRIFIYHSNPERKMYLEKYIKMYYQKIGCLQNIDTYSNAEEAAAWLKTHGKKADILFLDCTDLPVAMNMAELLRKDNLRASWVYMDGSMEGLCEALLMRPSIYLKDSADKYQIIMAIHKLEDYHRKLQKQYDFIFKFEGYYVRIPFKNISYFESSAKKVTLYLKDRSRTYYFTAKLDGIEQQMPDYFLRCHQSYLVNLKEVRLLDMKDNLFVLNNNEVVPISRRHYSMAKERYEQFLRE